MTANLPTSSKSPQFVMELIALARVNILAYLSNQITLAIGVDTAILGYHVGNQT